MISVASEFRNLISELRTYVRRSATEYAPQWFKPPGGLAAPYRAESSRKAFPREALNAETTQAAINGSVGRVIALRLQLDYTAIAERAYALRHMPAPRAAAHAVSRRDGHAGTTGVFQGDVLQHVQDLLASGG